MNFTKIMVRSPVLFLTILMLILIIILLMLSVLLYFKIKTDKAMGKATRELKMITESISAGVINFIVDESFTIKYANNVFYNIIEKEKDYTLKSNNIHLIEYISKDQQEKFIEYFKNIILEKAGNIKLDTKMTTKDLREIDVILSGQVSYKSEVFISATIIDISHIKALEKQLLLDKKRYEISAQLSNSIVFEYDINEDRLICSEKFNEIFGRDVRIDKFKQEIDKRLEYIHPDDRSLFLRLIKDMEEGIFVLTQELRIKGKFDEYLWCQLSGKTIVIDNKSERIIGKITDITTFKNNLNKLEFKATRDPLTSVYNKETIQTKIKNYISSNRFKMHMVMFVDFDDFKDINDKYGHILGDKVLIQLSQMLKDSFVEDEMIGRIGGDEFVVFMGNINNKQDLFIKTEELINKINKVHNFDGQDIKISVSIGISIYPYDGSSYEDLLKHADEALYVAKNKGKKRYQIHNEDLVKDISEPHLYL